MMTTEAILFRVAMLVVPAVFSLILAGFWFFYKLSLANSAKRLEGLFAQYTVLAGNLSALQMDVATLKERYVTHPQVETIIDKRLEYLQKEMILRFDTLEQLMKQIVKG